MVRIGIGEDQDRLGSGSVKIRIAFAPRPATRYVPIAPSDPALCIYSNVASACHLGERCRRGVHASIVCVERVIACVERVIACAFGFIRAVDGGFVLRRRG